MLLDHIRSGITTTTDTAEGSYALPGALDAVDKACIETGIRAVLSFETTGRISEENAAMGLQENVNFIKKCRARDLIGSRDALVCIPHIPARPNFCRK